MSMFGVSLILPECAFTAELQRESILEMMKDIDEQLTEQGAPDEPEARCVMMVDNGLAISHLVAHREIDHESGVADIAYSFIYAFGKAIGFEQIDVLRGLTGSFLHNKLNLNPCLGEGEYDTETLRLQTKMADHAADGDYPDLNQRPSIH